MLTVMMIENILLLKLSNINNNLCESLLIKKKFRNEKKKINKSCIYPHFHFMYIIIVLNISN